MKSNLIRQETNWNSLFGELRKFIAMIIMILGYGVIAVPTGLVAAGVATAVKEKLAENTACPKCKSKEHLDNSNYCQVCGTDLTVVSTKNSESV